MTVDDVDAVAAVDQLAFTAPWKAAGFRYEVTENELAHYQVLTVIEAGGDARLIGFVGHWLLAGEAHISTLAVHPDWRGRGLGELLLLGALGLAAEQRATVATLEVRRSNVVAQALYGKYRFRQVGVRRRYYRDNREDALIMTGPPLDDAYVTFLMGQWSALARRLAKLRVSADGRVK